MSCFKAHGMGVGLTLSACVAMGEPLPESSLLGRFGMTVDDLPAAAVPEPSRTAVEEPVSRFQLQPELPVVDIRFSERTEPESVGNISIDNMRRRDQEHCLRLLEQSVERDPGRAKLLCD
ncbi:hypothetical protein NLK61_09195 [Pseudomonas fuscovaginae UPB0736]|uniref:Uncharacterized protein n=1 Tax=Pseudomonas asplenii TaxID=53407 RepID=A0A1H6NFK6_9PSED|nr:MULTISPECIES: hypothetical protein [Pseudomonas]UUQ66796.1 hypothetical protein NLK61_09195 [Pseudomonas fuscovaginae UPB0736]UZE29924.1 hypothetical protein LOY63_04045 [Pseudomonas asplenii]SEI09278.1 hypothetical protein SAMN05216581_2032 [Pseudomonas fuscovaginae]